jgi:hypothetical protein
MTKLLQTPVNLAMPLLQPWAFAVMAGLEVIPVRDVYTAHRGRVLVYACGDFNPEDGLLRNVGKFLGKRIRRQDLLFAVILGTVEIVGCEEMPDAELRGTYNWVFAKPKRLAMPPRVKRLPKSFGLFKPF